MAYGVVKWFKTEKGTGAIRSSELPPGRDAWVHFSVIEGQGYRSLEVDDAVEFDYEAAQQDSFDYRVTRVRRLDPGETPPPAELSPRPKPQPRRH
jgi:CspA family cold shock protein